jgi:hypothetical protein
MEDKEVLKKVIALNSLGKRPETEVDLEIFLLSVFRGKLKFPKAAVCEGHEAPFKVLLELWRNERDSVVWANRKGGKSTIAALILLLKTRFYKSTDALVLSGSFTQSQHTFEAYKNFLSLIEEEYSSSVAMVRYIFKNLVLLSNSSRVVVPTVSEKTTRGPHPNLLILDEVEEMEPHTFYAALGQPIDKGELKGHILAFATRHKRGGNFDYLLKSEAFRLYKWCFLEVLKNCDDYSCSRCKLSEVCGGRKKEAMKKALNKRDTDGFYSVEEAVKDFQRLGNRSPIELKCELFAIESEAFPNFNRELVFDKLDKKLVTYVIGVDVGYSEPSAVVVCGRDEDDTIYILEEEYRKDFFGRQLAENVEMKYVHYDAAGVQVDVTEYEFINLLKSRYLKVIARKVPVVQSLAKIDALFRQKRLFIHRSCENLINELERLKILETGKTYGNRHAIDAMRYAIQAFSEVEMAYLL